METILRPELRNIHGIRDLGRMGARPGRPIAGPAKNERQTDRLDLRNSAVSVYCLAACCRAARQRTGLGRNRTMQALIMTAQTGFGMFLGTQFAGIVMDKFRKEEQFQWNKIFMVPGAVALACILVFLSSSRDKRSLWKVMRNSISSASMGDEVSI